MSKLHRIGLGALLAIVLAPLAAGAGPRAGDLDPMFDGDGKVRIDLAGGYDEAWDVVVQRDSKVVVTGHVRGGSGGGFVLARYTTRGALDPTFDADGLVRTSFAPASSELPNALALQPDGKLVVAGSIGIPGSGSGSDFGLARYNTDGTLDADFDGDGKVITNFGISDWAWALAIAPDGKIVAAGPSRPSPSTSFDFAVARYNANGSLDTSFSGDGKVTTPVGSGSGDYAETVAVQADGRIVVGGVLQPGGNESWSGVLVRYLPDGTLDASFDGDGILLRTPGETRGVAVQADGKIVAVADYGFRVTRFNSDGSLDTAFGSGGIASASLGNAGASSLVVQTNGNIVAVGTVAPAAGQEDFAVGRFRANGSLDGTFGSSGTVVTDLGGPTDFAYSVALAPDGKIVAAGGSGPADQSTSDFALARYLGAPPSCRVPNVRGKKLAVARSAITKGNCSLGKVKRKTSRKVKRNRVISQSPKAGTTLPNLGKVNLVVSKGRRR